MDRKNGAYEPGGDTRRTLEQMNALLYKLNLGVEEVKARLSALNRTLTAAGGAIASREAGEERE